MSWLKLTNKLLIVLILVHNINCDTSNSFACGEGVVRGSCTVSDINSDTKFNVTMTPGRYKYNVYYLTVKNSSLAHLPFGIFKDLVNLNTLNIVNCGVRELIQKDFDNAKKLRFLNLSQNLLTKLDADIFSGAVTLEQINFASNQIEQIDANAFRSLNKLQRLILKDNKIKSLPNGLFSTVNLLNWLDLSNNSIVSLTDSDLFSNLNFNYLDLSSNQLKTVAPIIFANCKRIAILKLSFNEIVSLDLTGMSNTETILLNNNRLTNLILNGNIISITADNNNISSANLFGDDNDVMKVNRISMKNNSLSSIEFVSTATNLTYLDVSFNPLGSIEGDTFSKLTKLRSLLMESVNLQKIDYELLERLANLEILDLSYNNLTAINFHSLAILGKLKELYINGNNLATITLEEFAYLFPNLKKIDFSDNNLQCSNLIEILKTLRSSNIEVDIDEDKLTTTEDNIRGIRCNKSPEPWNGGKKRPAFIHSHPNLASVESINISEIVMHLNQLQYDNDELQDQINQISGNLNSYRLDKYAANFDETKSQVDELKKQNKMLADKLDQVLSKFNATADKANDPIDMKSYLKQIDNLNSTLEGEIKMIKLDHEVNHDIKFIKILMILLFAGGLIFGIYKVALVFIRRQTPYRSSPYNTMGVNLDENNF